ncbi:anthranilate synthase component I [Thioalkalivibrio sp. HK1]|uniref:anthranilate synthase component I n=1 Tax=Thioalkalivibrio sp. HK1 TaxID=1469245 RepID=UPI00046E9A47|nr:anthranilate synthase component I [Thioalkalivibrio sp. HK1]
MNESETKRYKSQGGITITRTLRIVKNSERAIERLAKALDERKGALLTSSFEYPGRYTRWDIGFCNPAIELTGSDRSFTVDACNRRGSVLLASIENALEKNRDIELDNESAAGSLSGRVLLSKNEEFPEEMRTRQPTLFSVVRALIDLFKSPKDEHLGLYGAFGYELAFQFDPVRMAIPRQGDERNLVLYLPDDILVVDHRRELAARYLYEFEVEGKKTQGLARSGKRTDWQRAKRVPSDCDHAPGEYAETVRKAIEAFRQGDLFEVVPGQTFFHSCPAPPSEIYRRLKKHNPAPYGALFNLGRKEYLVSASPEMYVRVEGRRIETCPISGTIARGKTPLADARQIRTLLNSEKEESELTMCTDVDRNDKSRVCEAGSIQVIGRRQIELYSRLIHTVDHVEGRLREGYDALDGFLAHTWAVTVTGAPKRHAIQFIEDHERSPRRWYGGAIGFIGFNGNMNTGLTLRTIRIIEGVAEVRAGATLLYGSDPETEEAETRLKASALIHAIGHEDRKESSSGTQGRIAAGDERPGEGRRVLMIDHEDSFVHTLAGYLRRTGAEVITYRASADGFPRSKIERERADLILLSPGPGRPQDFGLKQTIGAACEMRTPVFGVCLGLQGIVEYCGGKLGLLPEPMHGKASMVRVRKPGRLFEGLPERFEGGRYHSLYADRKRFPTDLSITAESDEGLVMAIEHKALPIAAVQFHPESILTLADDAGFRLIMNVVRNLRASTS